MFAIAKSFVGVALVAGVAGCGDSTRPQSPPEAASPVYAVQLSVATPANLPACTTPLSGTTAHVASPPSLWSCIKNKWIQIPCTTVLAGAVAYASATKTLWACVSEQWTEIVVPTGPQGPPGDAGAPGPHGPPGEAGVPGSLVSVKPEGAGSNCAAGGQRIDVGTDTNENGALEDGEVKSSSYVCNGGPGSAGPPGMPGMNGMNGVSSFVGSVAEPPGDNCTHGGVKLTLGLDANGNGTLDGGEATGVSYVCNGAPGSAGDGGTTGLSTLVFAVPEAPGIYCPAGGVRLQLGLDLDADGMLDPAEVQSTQYICNGGGPPPSGAAVRFIVMGDTGRGNNVQREVAIQIRDLCAREGCDFVVLLGNNIFPNGVTSVDDTQWQDKFELPYVDISMPFYAVLGNHDYGGNGAGTEPFKGPIQVAYGAVSAKFEMPWTFYSFRRENVGFVMLDTNAMLLGDTSNGDQRQWFASAVANLRASGAQWIVVSGHHPYRSNGSYGNAGNYEGLPSTIPVSGASIRSFYDDLVCGEANVVFAGHDNNRQWLNEPGALCGAELIVSGAGSDTGSFRPSASNNLRFGDDTMPGFMYVVIQGDKMTGRFVDITGATNFQHEVTRSP